MTNTAAEQSATQGNAAATEFEAVVAEAPVQLVDAGTLVQLSTDELVAKAQAAALSNQPPFSDQLKLLVKELSATLLAAPEARSAPQLVALGYWLRPAAVSRLQQQFEQQFNPQLKKDGAIDSVPVARGLAFQLPPENVDTLFVYSWVLSFLVGNSNVTRLPTSPNPIALWLVEQITVLLKKHQQAERQLFCYFDKNSGVGRRLSQLCDLRVVWGGDEKIAAVSRDQIQPDGLSIGFSDRKSICVIQTEAYKKLDQSERQSLAEKFYNDTYWFDQMGCGSPRLLVWVGAEDPAMDLFYEHLNQVIDKKGYQVEPGVAIDKLVFANEMIVDDVSRQVRRYRAEFLSLESQLQADVLDHVKGGGTLFYTRATELADIAVLARRDLQTITTFGFTREQKVDLAVRLNGKGGYRIVPIGEALNFDSVWDGMDLMQHFSRQITIR